jgi:NADPH:quinone reductase-like Zn-dependent oxidoreductase
MCRQGHSPGVPFPRILGIEAVGVVEDAPGAEFAKGDTVATAMGGMGRQYDGGYAEYTVVPATQVQAGTGLPMIPYKNCSILSVRAGMRSSPWCSWPIAKDEVEMLCR